MCIWWTAAMMIALAETGDNSAVKNQSRLLSSEAQAFPGSGAGSPEHS